MILISIGIIASLQNCALQGKSVEENGEVVCVGTRRVVMGETKVFLSLMVALMCVLSDLERRAV